MRTTISMAMAVVLLAVSAASAQSAQVPPRAIPYKGHLELNGAPFSGMRRMTFYLFARHGDPLPAALWSEDQDVSVTASSFAVELGRTKAISDSVFERPELYLGIAIDGKELKGRQRVASVPYAVRSSLPPAAMLVPPGAIVAYAGASAPPGWLMCDGSAVSRTEYAALFAAIGVTHGRGDGTSTFNLPDYRGRFLRGVDAGSFRDPDRASRLARSVGGQTGDAVGTLQDAATARPVTTAFLTDTTGDHLHKGPTTNGASGDFEVPKETSGSDTIGAADTSVNGNHFHSIRFGGDNETRPVNAAVYFLVKT